MTTIIENLPEAIKKLKRWCLAGNDKVPRNAEGVPIDPRVNGGTFDEVSAARSEQLPYLGVVLEGGMICLDVDPPKDEEMAGRQGRFLAEIEDRLPATYVETSLSGGGRHYFWQLEDPNALTRNVHNAAINVQLFVDQYILVTGNGSGEVSSGEAVDRFAAMSGAQMAQRSSKLGEVKDEVVRADDQTVLRRMLNDNTSANRERIYLLYYEGTQGGNRSEEDMELMNALESFSGNADQMARLFMGSALADDIGRKPRPEDYLERTIARALQKKHKMLADQFIKMLGVIPLAKQDPNVATEGSQVKTKLDPDIAADLNRIAQEGPSYNWDLPMPEGTMAMIYDYACSLAHKRSHNSAMVAAIGTMSWLCSPFSVNGGLRPNLYMLLVGKSGMGKDVCRKTPRALIAQATGTENLEMAGMKRAITRLPLSAYGFDTLLAELPEALVVEDEIGNHLKVWFNDSKGVRDMHALQVRNRIMDLYGVHFLSETGEQFASKKENIKQSIMGPFLSLVGILQPRPFFEAYGTEGADIGMQPRFLAFRAEGEFIPMAHQPKGVVDAHPMLLQNVRSLLGYVWRSRTVIDGVRQSMQPPSIYEYDCMEIADEYDEFAEPHSEGQFNRMGEHALKLSLLHCVSRGAQRVESRDFEWAKAVCDHSMRLMLERSIEATAAENLDASIRELFQSWKQKSRVERRKAWWEDRRSVADDSIHTLDNVMPWSWAVRRLRMRTSLWGGRSPKPSEVRREVDVLAEDVDWLWVGKASEIGRGCAMSCLVISAE